MDTPILPDFLITPRALIVDKDIKPLDCQVYGLVYWYTQLKLEKCIASNALLARLLGASVSGVSHALTNLARKGYIKVILDPETNARLEIIPTITLSKPPTLEPTRDHINPATPLARSSYPPSSNELHNNNNEEKDLIISKEINKESKIRRASYSSIHDITDTDLQDISDSYQVPITFVKLQLEKLTNYCASKGKRYKNYKAALRNFVVGDMQRQAERRMPDANKAGIDASFL